MHGPLAQSVEQKTFNLLVDGSNPSRPTNARQGFRSDPGPFFFFAIAISSQASPPQALSPSNKACLAGAALREFWDQGSREFRMSAKPAASITDELWTRLHSDIDPSQHFPEVAPKLAHYTSLFTAEAIFKGDEFWMSHPFLMNDQEELRWGIVNGTDRFVESKAISAAVASEDHHRIVIEALQDARDTDGTKHSYDTYIACFSKHDPGDKDGLLSMWRAYGADGGGVAIVFDLSRLAEDTGSPLIIAPVEYLSTRQRFEWMDWAIAQTADAIKALGPTADPSDLILAVRYYYARLRRAALFSKHESFSEEKEWRIVYDPTADESGGKYDELMSYAITPKGIQPKLKLRLGTKAIGKPWHLEDIIEAIILGPTGGSLIAEHAMRRLCVAAGKPKLSGKVFSSSTPYRP